MVKVYTIEHCPYCSELKDKLKLVGVDFEEVNVDLDENHDEFQAIVDATSNDSVPVVRVGNQLFVPEVSFNSIDEAVELTKKFSSELNS